jgi:quercetin dioxygenase-like cupin family protein
MDIVANRSPASGKSPANWFTGTVCIDPLFAANAARRGAAATVTFEPGTRTAWHRHPLGQTLIFVAGPGRVQREDGAFKRILRKRRGSQALVAV